MHKASLLCAAQGGTLCRRATFLAMTHSDAATATCRTPWPHVRTIAASERSACRLSGARPPRSAARTTGRSPRWGRSRTTSSASAKTCGPTLRSPSRGGSARAGWSRSGAAGWRAPAPRPRRGPRTPRSRRRRRRRRRAGGPRRSSGRQSARAPRRRPARRPRAPSSGRRPKRSLRGLPAAYARWGRPRRLPAEGMSRLRWTRPRVKTRDPRRQARPSPGTLQRCSRPRTSSGG
mmetsp:Transcript_80072/g.194122  ORF Transcript_80072/g.194122 Transcript_80072/m.194122 type:complete len:234 (+) Transcript_80072:200-901(+)